MDEPGSWEARLAARRAGSPVFDVWYERVGVLLLLLLFAVPVLVGILFG